MSGFMAFLTSKTSSREGGGTSWELGPSLQWLHQPFDRSNRGATNQTPTSTSSVETQAPASVFFQYPVCRGAAPGSRWAHSVAAAGNLMLVYGGVGHQVLDDLSILEVDTMTWRTVNPYAPRLKDRPDKMLGHSASVMANVMWMFGGQQGRKYLNHLYSYSLESNSWQRHTPASLPPARAGHSMLTVQNKIFIFGGQGKKLYNDMYSFDPATLEFTEVKVSGKIPSPRRGQSLCWDGKDSLVCFGGSTGSLVDAHLAVFSLSKSEWTVPQHLGQPPTARMQHSAVCISPCQILVFGGCNSSGVFYNDAYILDTRTMTWSRPNLLNTAPAPRYHHSCIAVNGQILLYGGINSKQSFDGVVCIETKFQSDISHVAEELLRLSVAPPSAATATPADGAGTPLAPIPETLLAATSVPQAPSPAAAAAFGADTGEPALDFMKLQLQELLVKRNMEEMQLKAVKKAEVTQAALQAERNAKEALQRELLQMKLMGSEAQEMNEALQRRCREAELRLQKESNMVAELRASLEAAQSAVTQREADLTQARADQEGLLKEIGIIASRYSRLQTEFDALRGRRKTVSSSGQRPHSQNDTQATQASSQPNSARSAQIPATTEHTHPVDTPHQLANHTYLVESLDTSNDSASPVTDAPQTNSSSPTQQGRHVVMMLAQSELQRVSLLESNTLLQEQLAQLEAKHAEALESMKAQLDANKAELAALKKRYDSSVETLAQVPMTQLRDVETELETKLKAIREAIMQRTMLELHKRASSEQNLCSLCMECHRSVAFGCGHQSCERCSAQLVDCPFCRVKISAKIKLFDS